MSGNGSGCAPGFSGQGGRQPASQEARNKLRTVALKLEKARAVYSLQGRDPQDNNDPWGSPQSVSQPMCHTTGGNMDPLVKVPGISGLRVLCQPVNQPAVLEGHNILMMKLEKAMAQPVSQGARNMMGILMMKLEKARAAHSLSNILNMYALFEAQKEEVLIKKSRQLDGEEAREIKELRVLAAEADKALELYKYHQGFDISVHPEIAVCKARRDLQILVKEVTNSLDVYKK